MWAQVVPPSAQVLAVVDITAVDGLAASGESAVFVAGAEESFEVGVRGVAVDGEHAARDGVAEHPIPAGGHAGEAAGGVDVDRGAPDEFGGSVAEPGEGEGWDGDVHDGPDGAETAEPERWVRRGGWVVLWGAGEQHVGEDVGSELADGAWVGDEIGAAIGCFGSRASGRAGTRANHRAGTGARARVGRHGGGSEGRARLGGGIADGARLLRQSVVDPVHERRGPDVDELAHPVGPVGRP